MAAQVFFKIEVSKKQIQKHARGHKAVPPCVRAVIYMQVNRSGRKLIESHLRDHVEGCGRLCVVSSFIRRQIMVFDCCVDASTREANRISRQIDKKISSEKERFRRQVKILLLGAGESGKSTFLKQMRIIHGEDYNVAALAEFRPIVYSNILKGMKVLADARRKLGIEWGDPNNQRYAKTILDFQAPQKIETNLFLQYVDAVNRLWQDEGIQTSYDRRREFQLVSLNAAIVFEMPAINEQLL